MIVQNVKMRWSTSERKHIPLTAIMPKIMETDIIWKGKGNNWGILIGAHITQWFGDVARKEMLCLKEEQKLL